MGNCQAVDAAALVIQHPSGKQERMYWSITASEVMKMNPGHYVSLIIPLPFHDAGDDNNTVRYTRVKLLRPTDTLVLGRAYRLVTTQEVMKVIRAKKHAKSNRNQSQSDETMDTNLEKCITSSQNEAAESARAKNNKVILCRNELSPICFSKTTIRPDDPTDTDKDQDQQILLQDGPNHGSHLYKAFLSSEAEVILGNGQDLKNVEE